MSLTLDQFISKRREKSKEGEPKREERGRRVEKEAQKSRLGYRIEAPKNTGVCYLLSITYDGKSGKALLKLYDPVEEKLYFWYDNTGHKPYFLTNLSKEEIFNIKGVLSHEGFDHVETIEKYDLLHDKRVVVTKIVAKDPLSVGGSPNSLREIIKRAGGKVWEARIKYHNCYIFDRKLIPGMPYRVRDYSLEKVKVEIPKELINEVVKLWENESEEERGMLREWLELFQVPVPDIKRVAVDIEVYSPVPDRIPDPKEAEQPVICVAMVDNKGKGRVFLLKRDNVKVENENSDRLPSEVEVKIFDEERDLLEEIFKIIAEYPVVLTFNGDNFDLNYLWHRALKLGFQRDEIPIILTQDAALLKTGIHIDLYKFFSNRSIQVYAFGNKYRETTLDAVASALLGIGKIQLNKPISELSLYDLATYCYRDAEITLRLTTFNNGLTMKLIILFMRIAKMSIEDLTRQGISSWIRNLFHFEHRKNEYLIPEHNDILNMKGIIATKATIKGKKYMGALVIKPKPGVHFRVIVLDFASLYPSVIKRWNLSYETIRCPHPECKANNIPETPHWVCTKRKGLTALIVGLLRDMRVKIYKRKAKDPSLSDEERNWYDVVQRALKVFINASYGVFGSDKFPLYCPPMAESTTALGRYAIKTTIAKAKEMNLEVIYGDTDSLFIKNPPEEKVKELVKWAEEELGIDLEVDKVYRYVTLSERKKNYVGVLEDGSIDIKGLMGKKRNTPEFLKKTFLEMIKILSTVKTPKDFETAKDEIRKIAHESYIRLKSRKYSLEDLAFKVMLSKPLSQYTKNTPQHVKAALQLTKYGKEVVPGDIIAYVKVRSSTGVKPVQLARIDEIDEEKYLVHMQTIFDQVLSALGISFNDIMGISRMDKFMIELEEKRELKPR